MNFNEVIKSFPKMQIIRLLLEENWMTTTELQEHLDVGRGDLVELCNSLQKADYISKSKRLIGKELHSCYAITSKGLREYQEYSLKVDDHTGETVDLDVLKKDLLHIDNEEGSIQQYFSN